jgi:hypothetical protein
LRSLTRATRRSAAPRMSASSVPIVPPRKRGGTERPEKGVYTHPFRPQTVPLTHLENMRLRNRLVQNRSSRSTKSFHGTVVWNGWPTTVPAKRAELERSLREGSMAKAPTEITLATGAGYVQARRELGASGCVGGNGAPPDEVHDDIGNAATAAIVAPPSPISAAV